MKLKNEVSKYFKYFIKNYSIFILFILLFATVYILRNITIIYRLQKKIEKYEKTQNCYTTIISENEDYADYNKLYYKDGVLKSVLNRKYTDGSVKIIIQITDVNSIKTYIDTGKSKVYTYNETDCPPRKFIYSYVHSESLIQTVHDSLVSRFVRTDYNGRDSYLIAGLYNSNFVYVKNTDRMKAYLDINTGLPLEVIERVQEKNGNKTEYKTTYTYAFDCVSNDDMKEPDLSEYQITKN